MSTKAFDSPRSTKRKDPLPFMLQLTSNTTDSCVTLKDRSDEENEEDTDEGPLKKFKVASEYNSTDALLSLNTDKVSFLQEVGQNETKEKSWKVVEVSNAKNEVVPFMSWLTSNTNESCVTLRGRSDEENEEDKDEGRDKAKEEGLETGLQLPRTMKELDKYLDGGTIFNSCSFNIICKK